MFRIYFEKLFVHCSGGLWMGSYNFWMSWDQNCELVYHKFSRTTLIRFWIQSFLSLKVFAPPRLKNPAIIRKKIGYNNIYIPIYIVSWLTVVEALFSVAITPRCRRGRYSFPWIAPLTLDIYLIMLSVKQWCIKYHVWLFGMIRPRIEPRSPGPYHWRSEWISPYKIIFLKSWNKLSHFHITFITKSFMYM